MFNSIFPSTTRPANFGGIQLNKQECQQWIRDKLQARGAKPFEFVQTVPGYDPSQSAANGSISGYHRNPQTEAFLQFLELKYLLDNTMETREPIHSPASSISTDRLYSIIQQDGYSWCRRARCTVPILSLNSTLKKVLQS